MNLNYCGREFAHSKTEREFKCFFAAISSITIIDIKKAGTDSSQVQKLKGNNFVSVSNFS